MLGAVKNHEIEEDVMTKTIDAARKFFALDREKKMEVRNPLPSTRWFKI